MAASKYHHGKEKGGRMTAGGRVDGKSAGASAQHRVSRGIFSALCAHAHASAQRRRTLFICFTPLFSFSFTFHCTHPLPHAPACTPLLTALPASLTPHARHTPPQSTPPTARTYSGWRLTAFLVPPLCRRRLALRQALCGWREKKVPSRRNRGTGSAERCEP